MLIGKQMIKWLVTPVTLWMMAQVPAWAHEAAPHVHTEFWNTAIVAGLLVLALGVISKKFLQ